MFFNIQKNHKNLLKTINKNLFANKIKFFESKDSPKYIKNRF